MSKKESAAGAAIAVSPSLSLREAVRPLIFAHALLTREQDLAGELARECRKLEQSTRKALEAAALVHLLAPDTIADDTDTSRRDQLIGAYAKAATTWAEVIGTAIALADALLDAGRPDDVRRLADFLEAAGESAVVKDLRTRADAAAKRANEARLARIHPDMTETEIVAAIEALRETRDTAAANFYIGHLTLALVRVLPSSREETVEYNFGSHQAQVTWVVSPRDIALRQRALFNWRGAGDPNRWQSGQIWFPALITKRLVTEDQKLTGSIPVASVIRIPEEIAALLENAGAHGQIAARLDILARAFWQIQAENARSTRPSE